MRTVPFFYFLLGWLSSLVTYVMSAFGNDLTAWAGSAALIYGAGLLVLFFVAILPPKDRETPLLLDLLPATKDSGALLAPKPSWITAVVAVGFAPLPITLNQLDAIPGGIAGIQDGQYVLTDLGVLVRILTEEEYRRSLLGDLLGYSYFGIVFLGVAVAILAPDRPFMKPSSPAD